MEFHDFKCPKCGGEMENDASGDVFKCSFCDSKFTKDELKIICSGTQQININGGNVNINITSDSGNRNKQTVGSIIDSKIDDIKDNLSDNLDNISSFDWNRFKPVLVGVICFIVLVTLIRSCSAGKKNKDYQSKPSVSVTQTETVSSTSTSTSKTVSTEPVVTEPVEVINEIEGDEISGSIEREDQVIKYSYVAPVTGRYHFAYDISDVTCSYEFKIKNSKKEKLDSGYSWGDGETVDLEAGEEYLIEVSQYQGTADFTIYIGVPNEPAEIEGDSWAGEIRYTDQIDRYFFTAPVTGRYFFAFDISDVTCSYYFRIKDQKKNKLGDAYSWGDGKAVDLVEGETYSIEIEYYSGAFNYEVNIGIPLEPREVEGDIEGAITFDSQENTYYYTAPVSGTYDFDFMISDKKAGYSIRMYDSKNARVFDSYSWTDGKRVKLDEGETYRIVIEQYSGVCEYTILISCDDIKDADSN